MNCLSVCFIFVKYTRKIALSTLHKNMSTLHGWLLLLLVCHKYPEMTMLLAYINNILLNTHATMGYGIWNRQ